MKRKTYTNLLLPGAMAGFAIMLVLGGFLVSAPHAWADSPHSRANPRTATCEQCHSLSPAGDGELSHPSGLGGDLSAPCVACHNGTDPEASNTATGAEDSFSLASGHSLATTSAGSTPINECSTCHNAHGDTAFSPMLPSKAINDTTVTASGVRLCIACHDSRDSWAGSEYPSVSAPVRDAAGYPVSGTWPGPATYLAATDAHSLIPETTQTAADGIAVRRAQGDCLYCHAAHRSANAYDALQTTFTVPNASTLASDQSDGSYAALCFRCHSADVPSGFTAPADNILQFATAPGGSGGHRVVTAGGTLPVGSPLPCFECHNPHGSKRGNTALISDELGGSLETTSPAGVRAFCFTCHTTADTTSGWDTSAQDYVPAWSQSVVGLPRSGAQLHLLTTVGHNQADTTSCYDCHGSDYTPGGNNVHDPSSGSAAAASVALAPSLQPVDLTPPLTTADLSQSHLGTVTLSAFDMGSGVEATYYVLDGNQATTGTVLSIGDEGTHTLQFWSVDRAGNVEPTETASFLVDRTPPVTTSDAQASYVGSATIELSSTDGTVGAGVAATYYELDGSLPATGTVVGVGSSGAHILSFWSVDNLGNAEIPQTAGFTVLDSPPPLP